MSTREWGQGYDEGYKKGWDDAMAEQQSGIKQVIELYDNPEQPAQQRPQNCGTSYCSCIECPYEQPAQQQECNHCGGTGDVSGEYPGIACPECNGSGIGSQPEFIKHGVENADDWSEWVCPDPKSYLMKCCDCGLVHEAQFGVVRYKSETEREDCEKVDDPNLQAVFRMRRSEQWSPTDTAHRAGGLPMEQPAQQEPYGQVTVVRRPGCVDQHWFYRWPEPPYLDNAAECHTVYTSPQPSKPWVGLVWGELPEDGHNHDFLRGAAWAEAKLQEKNA